jgi:hypothetical protein
MSLLPIRRIAITIPPAHWFHGIAADLAGIYRSGLVGLGIEVFDVPVDAFMPPDLERIARLTSALRAFAPDMAMGLSHGSYALICRLPPARDGTRPNLFTDVLDLPTVCLWDHAPVELADQVLGPLPADPWQSRPGALAELRSALNHPRLIHWSRDRGQSRVMTELGLAAPERIVHAPPPALPPFLNRAAPRRAAGVGFVGHLYQAQVPSRGACLDELARSAALVWADGAGPSLWHALTGRIETLSADARSRHRISRDETFFWSFAHRFIVHEAQTSSRLAALGAAGVTVSCIGNLDTGAPGVPPNLIATSSGVPFRHGLPEALTRHAVTLDVLNPGFIEGYSHKPVLGFAAGGFVLANRTRGFVENFGEAGAAATWTSHADLAAKIDLYLSRPALRREIGDTIRAEIEATHTLSHVLCRVLDQAWAVRGSPPRRRPRLMSRWAKR